MSFVLHCRCSVVASCTFTLKDGGLNLLEIFKFFLDNFTILYTSRLKTFDSNPLNNSTVRQFKSLHWFLYSSLIYICPEDSKFRTRSLQNGKNINEKIETFYADSNQCPIEWLSRMLPLSYKTIQYYVEHLLLN